ncbi:MAG: T9SS type A sorting domain-containing protein [Bacteroidia bacterium]
MRISFLILFFGLNFCYSQTILSDYLIEESTIWPSWGNPYILEQNLVISASGSLTLEAGVELRFDDGRQLIVQGSLTALGTMGQPVRIGPLLTTLGPNWKGILVEGKKAALHLQYTDVLLANTGLHLKQSGENPILVEDCTFGYGGTGLLLEVAPRVFTASRNAWVQNQIGLEFLTGGTFKSFRGNEICANTQYQAAMRTQEAVSIADNCWCELDPRASGKDNGILDRRLERDLGFLEIAPESNVNSCNILNPTADFIKGGGDITVVLDDYVSTQTDDLLLRTIRIYPQPMHTSTTIELSAIWHGPLQLSAFDLQGRLLWTVDYTETSQINLTRDQLPLAGMYLLRLSDSKGVVANARLIVE